jgi:hypothetical protein
MYVLPACRRVACFVVLQSGLVGARDLCGAVIGPIGVSLMAGQHSVLDSTFPGLESMKVRRIACALVSGDKGNGSSLRTTRDQRVRSCSAMSGKRSTETCSRLGAYHHLGWAAVQCWVMVWPLRNQCRVAMCDMDPPINDWCNTNMYARWGASSTDKRSCPIFLHSTVCGVVEHCV